MLNGIFYQSIFFNNGLNYIKFKFLIRDKLPGVLIFLKTNYGSKATNRKKRNFFNELKIIGFKIILPVKVIVLSNRWACLWDALLRYFGFLIYWKTVRSLEKTTDAVSSVSTKGSRIPLRKGRHQRNYKKTSSPFHEKRKFCEKVMEKQTSTARQFKKLYYFFRLKLL